MDRASPVAGQGLQGSPDTAVIDGTNVAIPSGPAPEVLVMRRWLTFLLGVAVGALLIYAVLNYHIVHARDGLHLIPKADATLAATYVDIRRFGPADWAQHPDLAMALLQANRRDLMESAAADALREGLDRFLDRPRDR
jgi:hypothetical protein